MSFLNTSNNKDDIHQINFGSPHNLLGAHQARIARLTPRLQVTLRWGGPLKAPGSPGINGVKSCILNKVLFKVDTYHNIHIAKNKKNENSFTTGCTNYKHPLHMSSSKSPRNLTSTINFWSHSVLVHVK
jgi:hypothetical protein